jgi:hypothetical protein
VDSPELGDASEGVHALYQATQGPGIVSPGRVEARRIVALVQIHQML